MLIGHQNHEQCKHPERQQAHEKRQHNRTEHQDDLLAGALTLFRFARTHHQHGTVAADQMPCDNRVQNDKHNQRQHKEQGDDHQEVANCPGAQCLRQADVHIATVHVLDGTVFGNRQNRTGPGCWG